jgi:hypothetical protein
MSAVTWQVDAYASNFLALPIGVLHGSDDPTCPVSQPRATVALLERLGAERVRYVEIAGAKHEYQVWGNEPPLLKELASRPRERYPKRLSFSVQTLLQPWCGPVRIDSLEKTGDGKAGTKPTGGVDVEIDGSTVRLFTSGVRALTLALSSDEIDLSKPVEVVWNGKRVHQGVLEKSAVALLETAGDTCDWSATREARIELKAQ